MNRKAWIYGIVPTSPKPKAKEIRITAASISTEHPITSMTKFGGYEVVILSEAEGDSIDEAYELVIATYRSTHPVLSRLFPVTLD